MGVKLYDGNDLIFRAACRLAEISQPTRRQYRKWLQGRGKAHAQRQQAEATVRERQRAIV